MRRSLTASAGLVAAFAVVVGGWLAVSRIDLASASGTFTDGIPALHLHVDPPNGTTGVRPDAVVTASAEHGRITAVELVADGGAPIAGTLAGDGSSWAAQPDALAPATHYRLTVHGSATRGSATHTSSFTTLTPSALFDAVVSPDDNQVVGIGAPIVAKFKRPVLNRAAVERRLLVRASPPVVGAWHWFDNQEAHWRPQTYWPAGTVVEVDANLAGVDAGNGVWGRRNITVRFKIGDAHLSTVDISAHTMVVTSNGRTVATYPMSAGRPKYPTMGGVHIALEKQQDVLMDSATNGIPRDSPDGYYEHVFWNVRISNGGEYVHAAPWSVNSQGNNNVSHGCVNLSPGNATWFFNFAQVGDVVEVVNSARAPTGDAGTRDWNTPWADWLAGSALSPPAVG